MPRNREKKTRNLPADVYIERGRYVYRPYLGVKNGKRQFGKREIIGPETLPISQVYAFLESMEENEDMTLAHLLDDFKESSYFKKQNANYQYTKGLYIEKLKEETDERGKVYSDYPLEEFQVATMSRLLDNFQGSRGHARKTLIAAWSWGRRNVDNMPPSPLSEVEKEPRNSRADVYVTDEEYEAVYELADPYWKALMEFAYICRARRSEITKMHQDQLLESGVELRRTKGSWDEITLWTPRLKNALAMLDEHNNGIRYENVFGAPNKYKGKGPKPVPGTLIPKNTLDKQWQKLMKKAREAGVLKKHWVFHDLKGKGVTDHKELISGHKTLSAKQVYIRKSMVVEGTR